MTSAIGQSWFKMLHDVGAHIEIKRITHARNDDDINPEFPRQNMETYTPVVPAGLAYKNPPLNSNYIYLPCHVFQTRREQEEE